MSYPGHSLWWGGLTPLQKCSQHIFCPSWWDINIFKRLKFLKDALFKNSWSRYLLYFINWFPYLWFLKCFRLFRNMSKIIRLLDSFSFWSLRLEKTNICLNRKRRNKNKGAILRVASISICFLDLGHWMEGIKQLSPNTLYEWCFLVFSLHLMIIHHWYRSCWSLCHI